MKKINLEAEDINLLNSKIGLHTLLKNKKVDIPKVLEEVNYTVNLRKQQEELIKLQNWVIFRNRTICIKS